MDIATFLIATLQITQLSCSVQYSGATENEERTFDLTLDLQNNSGEAIYRYVDQEALITTNKLTTTPNYVVFPISSQADFMIDRRDLTATFGAFSGKCNLVKAQEVEKKI
jgi:hypothetical protein